MSGRKNICFFSMSCRHCQAFLGELSKTPYASEFELICVDPGKRPASFATLPSWLKVVPTLVIRGESEPRSGPGPVTNWLFERRMTEATTDSGIKTSTGGSKALDERNAPLSMPVYSADLSKPAIAGRGEATLSLVKSPASTSTSASTSASTPSVGEPTPYHINEMGSTKLSDSYAFLADSFSMEKGTGTNRIVRNFAQLHEVTGAPGVASSAAATGRSKKEEAQVSAMEHYMKMRDSDVPGPIKRM